MVDVTGSTIGDYHNYYRPKTYILYYPGDLENKNGLFSCL